MAFPVLLLDWESFTARQALLGPVNSPGKERRMFPALGLLVIIGRELGLFLLSLGNQVLFKLGFLLNQPGTPTMCQGW